MKSTERKYYIELKNDPIKWAELLKKRREFHNLNKERIKKRARELYQLNKEKIVKQKKDWREANPHKKGSYKYRRAHVATKYTTYKSSAKSREIDFLVSREEFDKLCTNSCFYCGSLPNPLNGIDRINNDLGYITGNMLACCSVCNRMKNTHSFDFFISHCKKVSDFQSSINKAL